MHLSFRYFSVRCRALGQTSALALAVTISTLVGCGTEPTPGFGRVSGTQPTPSNGNASMTIGSGGGSTTGSRGGSTTGGSGFSGSNGGIGDASVAPSGTQADASAPQGSVVCPAGLQCDVSCPNGGSTTISGTVYDPAGKNPIYNVAVYVPASPLQPLPSGVPTGADACSCPALFKSGAVVSTTTAVDGSFTLTNVPVGANVPLVVQIGKWRRLFHVNVTACKPNAQADHALTLPGTVTNADDSLPDIAVSTGSADSLECLMRRMGIPASEYVAGGGTTGHVHIFAGGLPGRRNGTGAGRAENPPMPGAPASPDRLWATQAQLMPYDIVLLSCEGGETYNANPPALEAYLNAGGRVFASHYHYAWFSGPMESTQTTYTAPADWGTKLATWSIDQNNDNGPIGGKIETTLNGTTKTFAKGAALAQWLKLVGALGANGVPANELSIYSPRYNAVVTPAQPISQPWITSDPVTTSSGTTKSTMYFSFDTPVNAPPSADGGAPNYCGRAVFSDLHVAGDPTTMDQSPPPDGCVAADLSPQEKALEFMLFDLSSCVVPDTVVPTTVIPPPPR